MDILCSRPPQKVFATARHIGIFLTNKVNVKVLFFCCLRDKDWSLHPARVPHVSSYRRRGGASEHLQRFFSAAAPQKLAGNSRGYKQTAIKKGKSTAREEEGFFSILCVLVSFFFLGSFVSRRRRNMNATKSDGPYKFGLQQRKRSRELSIRLVTYSTARLKY